MLSRGSVVAAPKRAWRAGSGHTLPRITTVQMIMLVTVHSLEFRINGIHELNSTVYPAKPTHSPSFEKCRLSERRRVGIAELGMREIGVALLLDMDGGDVGLVSIILLGDEPKLEPLAS
jgi:hypothetical protein